MRDLAILSFIIGFWIILGAILTYVYQDPLIIDAMLATNSSYVIRVDTDAAAGNLSGNTVPLFQDATETSTKGFLNMIGRMLTFRIPSVEGIPNGFLTIIESVNFLLVLITGLIIYRLIRHGGG